MTKKELINSSNFLDAKLLKDEKEKKANKYNINVNKIQRKSETNQKDKKNDEILKNKKIYETLITYNCISIVIIIYLLYLLKNLKSNLN